MSLLVFSDSDLDWSPTTKNLIESTFQQRDESEEENHLHEGSRCLSRVVLGINNTVFARNILLQKKLVNQQQWATCFDLRGQLVARLKLAEEDKTHEKRLIQMCQNAGVGIDELNQSYETTVR